MFSKFKYLYGLVLIARNFIGVNFKFGVTIFQSFSKGS